MPSANGDDDVYTDVGIVVSTGATLTLCGTLDEDEEGG